MSVPTLPSIAARLRAVLVEVAWAQWSGLEGWSAGTAARSIVDPEALLLASCWLEAEEPRLWRVARAWARGGARFLSVQRVRNLAPHYPAVAQHRLADFAWECLTAGKDARWRPIARAPTGTLRERLKELPPSPRFTTPAALLLRLRIGLGVGIKADVLACLLGNAGGRRTIRDIAIATGYDRRAVDRAVTELATAGFVTALATAPITFRAELDRWDPLLRLGQDPPRWYEWDAIYRLGGALDGAAADAHGATPARQASRARDVVEAHYAAFDLNGIPVQEVTAAPGEAYLEVLDADIRGMADRLRRNMI